MKILPHPNLLVTMNSKEKKASSEIKGSKYIFSVQSKHILTLKYEVKIA